MASVVIHRYVKVSAEGLGISKAHIRYIQHRRGDDKERANDDAGGGRRMRRELFDGERDSLDRRELNHLIDREGEGGIGKYKVAIHKLTLSPGVQGVDLKEYTREVMDELGRQKGLDLVWGAAAHKNTEHDHVHVVVLGSDKNGRSVRIDRGDHDLLRYKSDLYLEREHAYDRELEREVRELERVTKDHALERADDRISQLLGKGQGGKEQTHDERTQEETRKWSKERALEEMPERQKIHVQGDTYTRYNSAEELRQVDEHLKRHFEDRLDKQQYAMLHRWIEAKERHGDDCHERWDEQRYEKDKKRGDGRETQREFHEFDKQAKRAYDDRSGVIYRHMPRGQRLLEERGRNIDYHVTYMNLMARQRLQEARDRTSDPDVAQYIEKELEMLKEHQRELLSQLPPIDLDRLYGKEERERGRGDDDLEYKTQEPDKTLNVDDIKFSDPLKDQKEQGREDVQPMTQEQLLRGEQEGERIKKRLDEERERDEREFGES